MVLSRHAHRQLCLLNQEPIDYRVYLSVASMEGGKELDKQSQILIGMPHALMN
jgi:hypothetical protein